MQEPEESLADKASLDGMGNLEGGENLVPWADRDPEERLENVVNQDRGVEMGKEADQVKLEDPEPKGNLDL